ncbi:hypothetical protein J437_LFUL019510 [Ladona fulva]|uniref:THAP-type domain-containing protein n=1 Tax=Ladona fulva TaxID=123851 RepID=A0A8K0KB09_LADFU|nr:hypothetical protein J437_LFUL019510 [Ladona fulva]
MEWVRFARNPRLNDRRLETLWKSTFLCQHHFTNDQYISFTPRRLVPNAVPTVPPLYHLPASSSLSSQSFSASSSPSTSAAAIAAENQFSSEIVGSSSSCPPRLSSSQPLSIHSSSIASSLATPLCASPSAVENLIAENLSQPPSPQSPFQIHSTIGPSSSAALSTYSDDRGDRSLKRQRTEPSVLREAGLRIRDLTPQKKFLFCSYKNLSRRYAYLRKKKTTDPLADLDPSLHLMVESNLRNVKRKPKGRRWSREEKLFYCTLYKRSPQTYRYLRERMSAPAPQTLISLINSVPLKPGINPTVFEHLTFRAKDMMDQNKYCTLLFDEMSIKPKLIYNSRCDCIDVFEDHGNRGRSSGIAREALVFMVRGLKSNWKQPVAYYYSKKSVPGEVLAELIKEVINAVDKTGLKIVATICDMDSNNVKALKLLGYSYDNPFFLFNGQEIFTMHDPPHLLKCTRNMFMKYPVRDNVSFVD